jgi:NDP-sugar pyrophosphorylase family protein
MEAIILAGGKGTRLAPYTSVLPKPLIPISGTPISEVIIRQLKHHGFQEITMATGYLSDLIKTYYGDGSKIGVSIKYIHEEKPLGTVGPLYQLKGAHEPYLVMNGDVLTTLNYRRMMEVHKENKAALTIATQKKEETSAYGHIEKYGLKVTGVVEKPTQQYEVSMGIYIVSPEALNRIPDNTFYDMPQLIEKLIDSHENVIVYENDDLWIDVGQIKDLKKAAEIFEEKRHIILKE